MNFFEAYSAYKQHYIDTIAWLVKDPWVKGKTHEETFENHINKMKASELIEALMDFSGFKG